MTPLSPGASSSFRNLSVGPTHAYTRTAPSRFYRATKRREKKNRARAKCPSVTVMCHVDFIPSRKLQSSRIERKSSPRSVTLGKRQFDIRARLLLLPQERRCNARRVIINTGFLRDTSVYSYSYHPPLVGKSSLSVDR